MTMPDAVSVVSSDVQEESFQCFRFFDLPPELRMKIYDDILHVDQVVDINFKAQKRLNMFLVSKRFSSEAARSFFGGNRFRLLPTHHNAVARWAQPIIRRLSAFHRSCLTSVELRVGPFWTQPPMCWRVDDTLGLEDASGIRFLRVFVQCDPSHPMYQDWRISTTFFTDFCAGLLKETVRRLPNLVHVQFDNYSGVDRDGPLLRSLLREASAGGKKISWGCEGMNV